MSCHHKSFPRRLRPFAIAGGLALASLAGGCTTDYNGREHLSSPGRGALIGAGGGAALGAITGGDVVAGAALGAGIGAIIGVVTSDRNRYEDRDGRRYYYERRNNRRYHYDDDRRRRVYDPN